MILGILAGEPSGDRLGAGLMAAMKRRQPEIRFVGIGGPLMVAEGLEILVPMDRLTMNGFIEPLKRSAKLGVPPAAGSFDLRNPDRTRRFRVSRWAVSRVGKTLISRKVRGF